MSPESITDSVPTYRSETFLSAPCFRGTGQADRYLDGICIKPFWDDEGRDNVFANIHDRWSPDDPTNQDVFYPRMYVGSDANTNNVQEKFVVGERRQLPASEATEHIL